MGGTWGPGSGSDFSICNFTLLPSSVLNWYYTAITDDDELTNHIPCGISLNEAIKQSRTNRLLICHQTSYRLLIHTTIKMSEFVWERIKLIIGFGRGSQVNF